MIKYMVYGLMLVLCMGCSTKRMAESTPSNVLLEWDYGALIALERAPSEDILSLAGTALTKAIAPYSSRVTQESEAKNLPAAFAAAKESDVDYLFFLSVDTWSTSPQKKTKIKASVYDVASGQLLFTQNIKGACPNRDDASMVLCIQSYFAEWAYNIYKKEGELPEIEESE